MSRCLCPQCTGTDAGKVVCSGCGTWIYKTELCHICEIRKEMMDSSLAKALHTINSFRGEVPDCEDRDYLRD